MSLKFLILILSSTLFCSAQLSVIEIEEFKLKEDSLQKIAYRVFFSKKEGAKFEANRNFLTFFNSILQNEKSIQFQFDTLKSKKYISILDAPDKKFRIITWNLYKEDGTYAYFGFLQVNNTIIKKKTIFSKKSNQQLKTETTKTYTVYPLLDKSGTVKSPESYVGEPSKWFGMLYVDIIKSKDDYYTLIGWDGNDRLVQRKFIDVLFFKSDGLPIFGKDVFKFPGRFAKRIMFEYASEVSMSLKYNESRKQIIFSHLAPNVPDPLLEGQFQYYGPDGSFDALTLKKGKWDYEPAIDITNLKDKNDNIKKPNPNNQTPLYKP